MLLLLPVAVLASGCSTAGDSSPDPSAGKAAGGTRKPIRIAFNTWIGYSSFYIADEKGFFQKRGITVETKVVDPLAEKNAAMVRGDLDGMGGTVDSAIISTSSGVHGKAVFVFDRSNGADGILVTNTVQTVADLAGKKVAVEEGFVGHFFLLYLLEKNRMPLNAVNIVPMSTDAAGAAFAAGKVDVAVTWEPYLSTAKKRQGARVLISSRQIEPVLVDMLLLSDTFVQNRPGDVNALVAGLQEANTYWLAHPDECREIVARRWKMKPTEVADILKNVQLYGVEQQKAQFGLGGKPAILPQSLARCASLWLKAKVIPSPVATDGLVDDRAVRAVTALSIADKPKAGNGR